MSYMRGEFYVWSDGVNLHIHDRSRGDEADISHVVIPNTVFEELAAMYFLRMTEKEREKAIERAYENHGGNFGCEGVAKYLGKEGALESVMRMAAEREKK